MTILLMMGKKIGLADRGLLKGSVNTLEIGGIVRITKLIVKGTLLPEGLGAILFSLCFVSEFGILKGIYYGIFHYGVNIYGRRLEDGMIEKAAVVFTLSLTMAVTASFLICAVDGFR